MPAELGVNEQVGTEQGVTERGVDPSDALTASTPAAPAAPAFVMVGAVDAGLCVDGVCALPGSPARN